MTADRTPARGRPPAASREMLQDAAFELFLEQGYAGTTVEHITRRAGVSRNTFFNYFEAKADVFWVEVDATLERLEIVLDSLDPADPLPRTQEALRVLVAEFGPDRVPFVLTQHGLIGSVQELQASAVVRIVRGAASIREFLVRGGVDGSRAQAAAYALLGAATAGSQAWAAAGSSRGTLAPYFEEATAPVFAGFTRLASGTID